jgi:hypothetical protein
VLAEDRSAMASFVFVRLVIQGSVVRVRQLHEITLSIYLIVCISKFCLTILCLLVDLNTRRRVRRDIEIIALVKARR